MKTESDLKPIKTFEIENIKNGKCDIVFYSNINKKEQNNNEESTKDIYEYEIYRINVDYREGIEDTIENSYNTWLEFAKKKEYDKLAAEIREKRNELLKETDKEMCLDRLNLQLPKELTASNMLSGIKKFFESFASISNGSIAKYRQELRDITKQESFPYNVVWPTKED